MSVLKHLWRPVKDRVAELIELRVAPIEASVAAISSELAVLAGRMDGIEACLEDQAARKLEVSRPVRLFSFESRHDSAHVGDLGQDIPGDCPICGASCFFRGFTSNLRESGYCSSCGSFNRQRQIASMVRHCFCLGEDGPLALPPSVAVYNTETTGALDAVLRGGTNYLNSEYFGPDYSPGQNVDGRRHEDLQNLSIPSESIDLMLSSDVLEHMPSPYAAHREVFRILKPGGRHIFTVPFSVNAARDDIRAELVDGEIKYLAEKLFHGDPVRPDEGILVWTIFGIEMILKLRDIGFDVNAWDAYNPGAGIIGKLALVFEARKPFTTA
ncbi:MAG: methyltransferase domain-containing protein [Pseudorhodoferax sp.]